MLNVSIPHIKTLNDHTETLNQVILSLCLNIKDIRAKQLKINVIGVKILRISEFLLLNFIIKHIIINVAARNAATINAALANIRIFDDDSEYKECNFSVVNFFGGKPIFFLLKDTRMLSLKFKRLNLAIFYYKVREQI